MLLVCVIKNRKKHIKGFIKHYTKMGVQDFHFIDNNSTDGTYEKLKDYGFTVVRETRDYKESDGCALWVSEYLEKIGVDKWCLTVDSDELFLYPGFPERPIQDFCNVLELGEYRACFSPLVDMYANSPIEVVKPSKDWLSTCPYFDDIDGYVYRYEKQLCPSVIFTGGVRSRVFYDDNGGPWMQAVGLVKWRKNLRHTYGRHSLNRRVKLFNHSAILHFKFFNDIYSVVEDAIRTGKYSNDSAEYKRYSEKLKPETNLFSDRCSVKYKDCWQILFAFAKLQAVIPHWLDSGKPS